VTPLPPLRERAPRRRAGRAVPECLLRDERRPSCYPAVMKVVTAQVIGGMIAVPAEIADGSQVAILAPDDGKPVELSAGEERELSEALAEIQTGRYVDGWDLLAEIKAKSRA